MSSTGCADSAARKGTTLERELKLALDSEADYERLVAALPAPISRRKQRNSYWDLPGRPLGSAQTLLRLRLDGDSAWITVKGPAQVTGDGIFEAEEDECEVAAHLAERVARGERPLAALGGDVLARLASRFGNLTALAVWGRIENLRFEYEIAGGLVLELDRTLFPGGVVDWEIEAESADPAATRSLVIALLDGAGVRYRPQTLTKSERLAKLALP